MIMNLSNPSVFFEGCTISNKPESYSLVQKLDGLKDTYYKWRDIPTVIEELKGE